MRKVKRLEEVLSDINNMLKEAYERVSAEEVEEKEKSIETPKDIYVNPETGKLVRNTNL